jgi:hypothetical protein
MVSSAQPAAGPGNRQRAASAAQHQGESTMGMSGPEMLGLGGWEVVVLLVIVLFWVAVAVIAYWIIRRAVRAGVIDAHRRLDAQAASRRAELDGDLRAGRIAEADAERDESGRSGD